MWFVKFGNITVNVDLLESVTPHDGPTLSLRFRGALVGVLEGPGVAEALRWFLRNTPSLVRPPAAGPPPAASGGLAIDLGPDDADRLFDAIDPWAADPDPGGGSPPDDGGPPP